MKLKIGEQIANLRKKRELTQEELAKILGVTNQAVSKWESNKCCPDIELLPVIAETFKCSIDALFGIDKSFREGGNTYELCSEFPWADDEIIRGVVCMGRKILTIKDKIDKFTFNFVGEAKNVKSHCNLSVFGSVKGECSAGHDFFVEGSINGGCNAGGDISIGGDLSGAIMCGDGVECGGNINGNIIGEKITAGGDITAENIKGNVVCKTLKCDDVEGEVKIN